MSKNFEKEYKEYLNAQAPDLWDRIEAGVDSLEKAARAGQGAEVKSTEKVVPISAKKSRKEQKKRRVRYQHYRMIASVAACLFALVIIVPIYLLTGSDRKSESATDAAPQMVENVTIQNLVVDASEGEMAAEEAAPMEEVVDGVTEIAVGVEDPVEESLVATETAQQTENTSGELEEAGITGAGEAGGQVAGPQEPEEDAAISDMLQEGENGQQKEMTVTILGEGTIQEGGVMYTAAENDVESSETISLFVPEGSGIVLAADGVYVISAKITADGSYYIVEIATLQ